MQEIVCVLDKSGSMQSVKSDAVGGFNKFIYDQKEIGRANLTLIWFDDSFEVSYEGDLDMFNEVKSWPNGGMTALTDAIGKTFNHVRERFTNESPEKVILCILTDGEENASKEFTSEAVKKLIEEHQSKYGWSVVFLAADQDAWAAGGKYGINKNLCVNYDSQNTIGGFESMTNITRDLRST
jgi:Mg-chelatase subunit ChlD